MRCLPPQEPQGRIFVTQQASRSSRRGRTRSLGSRAGALSNPSSNLSRKGVATTHQPKTRSPHLALTPFTLRVMACAAASGDTVGQNGTAEKRQSMQIESFARKNRVRDPVIPSSSGCSRLGSTHATVEFCQDPIVCLLHQRWSWKGRRDAGPLSKRREAEQAVSTADTDACVQSRRRARGAGHARCSSLTGLGIRCRGRHGNSEVGNNSRGNLQECCF